MLVFLGIDEASVQICVTMHKSRTCENLSLPNLNIKTESADQPVRRLCCPLFKKDTISSFYVSSTRNPG